MTPLELLAPARNADIGIAAIRCGADAVYIAGPAFGARKAAGNTLEDIARLCAEARKFGAKVYLTLNTILFEDELSEAREIAVKAVECGIDAIIVQDLAMLSLVKGLNIPLHASTQCSITNVKEAQFYQALGFSRLILERQLSKAEVQAIASTVDCEIEFFVHGALCVSYSGKCYLSAYLDGRSANRGECIQACRSRYDLLDASGRIIAKDKALLSLKDLNLSDHIDALADAGVTSFKIEGRLKGESYVQNIVRQYSLAIDKLIQEQPDKYCRASFGRVVKGFAPDPSKTFNRGYTSLYIDGKKGSWAAIDTPKAIGEPIGRVLKCRDGILRGERVIEARLNKGVKLANGDGLCIFDEKGIYGFRCDSHEPAGSDKVLIFTRFSEAVRPGAQLWRNLSVEFEKQINKISPCERLISVNVSVYVTSDYSITAKALSEDGRTAEAAIPFSGEAATNCDRIKALIHSQLGKKSGTYSFTCQEIVSEADGLPLLSAASINELRRNLALRLDSQPCHKRPLYIAKAQALTHYKDESVDYSANVSNTIAQQAYEDMGIAVTGKAFELNQPYDALLMRSRYCIRGELGLCPKKRPGTKATDLYLLNNKRKLRLSFDCAKCEMKVIGG